MIKSFICLLAVSASAAFAQSNNVFPDFVKPTSVKEVASGKSGVFKFEVTQDDISQADSLTEPNLALIYKRALTEMPELKATVNKIYDDNGCLPDGTYIDPSLPGHFCGELSSVDDHTTVLWSNGRGGWADAYAVHKAFLTFTTDGSGHFTDVALELMLTVNVDAKDPMGTDGTPTFEVTITIDQIKAIANPQN